MFCAEIIQASVKKFTAQCYELDQAPPLGTLVKTASRDTAVFGVVTEIRTVPLDPGRTPTALGQPHMSRTEILAENPQLNLLFKTEIEVILVSDNQSLPLIHGGVELTEEKDQKNFIANFKHLKKISYLPEELILTHIKILSQDNKPALVRAGKELSRIFLQDAGKLHFLLKELTEII